MATESQLSVDESTSGSATPLATFSSGGKKIPKNVLTTPDGAAIDVAKSVDFNRIGEVSDAEFTGSGDAGLIAIEKGIFQEVKNIDNKTPELVAGNSPINVAAYTFVNSISNNSSAQLSAGGTFQGGIESAFNQQAIQIMIVCNQPYTLTLEQFTDIDGTKLVSSNSISRLANVPSCENMQVNGNFVRVKVTNNGIAATTNFDVQSTFGPLNPLPTALNPDGSLKVGLVSGELNTYIASIAIIPATTLADGTNYFVLRNPDASKKIKIKRIEALAIFTGTAVASSSRYAIKKITGLTATTGTAVVLEKHSTLSPVSIADVKSIASGVTLTGGTVGGSIASFGHANQLTANIAYDRDFLDSPVVLGQNEAISLRADGAIVAGPTVMISIRWMEEA